MIPASSGWIGPALSRSQVASLLFVGTVGVTIAGVQPVLLGSLATAGRISIAQIGHAATVELLTLGLGVLAGGLLFDRRPLRLLSLGCCLLLAVANVATLLVSGEDVTVMRGIAGLPGGVMLWMMSAMIVRSPRPTFWSAISLISQALVQFAVAAGIALIAPGSPAAVPVVMTALAAGAALATLRIPLHFAALPREPTSSGLPPVRGWVVLMTTLLLMACIVAAWVYIEPLGKQAGLTSAQIAFATPASLAAQLAGGGLAIALAGRVAWFPALTLAVTALAGVLAGLGLLPQPMLFIALVVFFGFLWTFISPYLTPFAIDNDPSRRVAIFVPAAMLIGSAIGPFAASLVIVGDDARIVMQLGAGTAILSIALIVALHVKRVRIVLADERLG